MQVKVIDSICPSCKKMQMLCKMHTGYICALRALVYCTMSYYCNSCTKLLWQVWSSVEGKHMIGRVVAYQDWLSSMAGHAQFMARWDSLQHQGLCYLQWTTYLTSPYEPWSCFPTAERIQPVLEWLTHQSCREITCNNWGWTVKAKKHNLYRAYPVHATLISCKVFDYSAHMRKG